MAVKYRVQWPAMAVTDPEAKEGEGEVVLKFGEFLPDFVPPQLVEIYVNAGAVKVVDDEPQVDPDSEELSPIVPQKEAAHLNSPQAGAVREELKDHGTTASDSKTPSKAAAKSATPKPAEQKTNS
jgi:hypothetical protein